MKTSSWCALLATVVGIGAFTDDGSASAETLRVQGSSGFSHEVMEPYKDRIEALAGQELKLTPTTSGKGLIALLKGEADLAMIWAPLDGMVALLRKSRPDLPFDRLHEFHVAKSWVAYSVNPGNPVRFVSIAKLKQILTGQIDNWRALGGQDLPIHVVSLRNGGGSKRATEDILLGGKQMTPRSAIIVESDAEVVQTVAHDRGALGICRASLVVDGLPKLRTSVSIGQSFSLVTLDEPTDAMRAVIVATRSVIFDEMP